MARLIIKNGYIKAGKKKHIKTLVKYIATRDGVEKIPNGKELWTATIKQKNIIAELLEDFPKAKECYEYEEYLAVANRKNASELIGTIIDENLNQVLDKQKYVEYISKRPRVEKINTHGLFGSSKEAVDLEVVENELANHDGNVWTPIISLRREDAINFGYDNALSWQSLINSQVLNMADAMKIHPDNFRWHASYHNEGHHPHIHMICYSTNPKEGFLTDKGIEKMKSKLANTIFKDELIPIYAEKTLRREQLKNKSAEELEKLIAKMKMETVDDEKFIQLMFHLANELEKTKGKKQYGYLKAELKNVVDEIVNLLAAHPTVDEAYKLWWEMKNNVELIYTLNTKEIEPLVNCSDFKSIKNMIIQQALKLNEPNMALEVLEKQTSNTKTLNIEIANSKNSYNNRFNEKKTNKENSNSDVENNIPNNISKENYTNIGKDLLNMLGTVFDGNSQKLKPYKTMKIERKHKKLNKKVQSHDKDFEQNIY